MRSMVALNVRSGSITTEVLGSMMSASNRGAEVLVSQVYAEKVHHLFNYGMNGCDDHGLVKNCIIELFSLIASRPDIVQEGRSIDTNIFKVFRRLLIRHLSASRERSISVIPEIFFSAETQMTKGLTSLQREAIFLKFQRRLTYREVANVMEITIEELRSEISKAVDRLFNI